jgi:hypothetical protein
VFAIVFFSYVLVTNIAPLWGYKKGGTVALLPILRPSGALDIGLCNVTNITPRWGFEYWVMQCYQYYAPLRLWDIGLCNVTNIAPLWGFETPKY